MAICCRSESGTVRRPLPDLTLEGEPKAPGLAPSEIESLALSAALLPVETAVETMVEVDAEVVVVAWLKGKRRKVSDKLFQKKYEGLGLEKKIISYHFWTMKQKSWSWWLW